jgi:gliding motility-associated-like protein
MKKNIFLFLTLFTALSVKTQTIYTTAEAYDALKREGHLKPRVKYKFLESNPKKIVDKRKIAVSNKLHYKLSTAGNGLLPIDATFTIVPMKEFTVAFTPPEYRNDDGYSDTIHFGFDFCFYGKVYRTCFINNNGCISFEKPIATFTPRFPSGTLTQTDSSIIAPFWADVDTQDSGSGLVYYKQTSSALIVRWNKVGYYDENSDYLNDFQLIITNGIDPILPIGNNVSFSYGDMQWATADDIGTPYYGFGGPNPALVGANKGDGTHYFVFGRFDQAGYSYDGPYDLNDGISFLDDKSFFFDVCGVGNNINPILEDLNGTGSGRVDSLKICALGDTLVYTTTFLAPEIDQSISFSASATSLGGSFIPLGIKSSRPGYITYAWMVVGSASVIGSHTITITGTDNGLPNLSNSANYYIKIDNSGVVPQPTLSVSPAGSVCATPGATLSLVNCSAYDKVFWSNDSSGCSIIPNKSDLYFVTVKKTGCYKSIQSSITVLPNPKPVILGLTNYCSPLTSASVSIALPIIGMPAYNSFTWTPGGINTPTAYLIGPNEYTVDVEDINGCIGSNTITITVLPDPKPIILGFTNYCSPLTSASVSIAPPILGMPAYSSFTWSPVGINTPTANLTGPNDYTIEVEDINGCIGSNTITITNGNPVLQITAAPLSICNSGSSFLNASISGLANYNWSNGATTQTTSVNTPGTYSCTVIVNSCVVSSSILVESNPTPTVTIPSSLSFCTGLSATISATILPSSGAYTYTWSNFFQSPSVTISTSTVLTLEVTDIVSGCKSSMSNSCLVTAFSSPTVYVTSSPLVFCDGLNATISPTVSGGTPAYNYTWSPGSLGSSSTITTNIVGMYSVIVTDQNLCTGTATINVEKSIPTVNLSSPDLTLCPSECETITANGTSLYMPYTYSWIDYPSISSNTLSICKAEKVTINFIDAKGCVATQTIAVVNDIIPIASFSASPPSPVLVNQPVEFTNTSSGFVTPVFWSFGDGGSATGNQVTYAYPSAGTYSITLVVSNANGCANSILINYIVEAGITTPNVITPNGDNANETLKFKNLEAFAENKLIILNRWGIKIFEKDSYQNDWNGSGYEDGTYFYILSVPKASPHIYKGFFEIIR